jgi:hypothetical protein
MDPMMFLAIIGFIIQLATTVWPIISKFIENWRNKTTTWLMLHLKTRTALPQAINPKEFTNILQTEFHELSKHAPVLQRRFYIFLGRITPRFSDALWDKFYPNQPKATSFSPEFRVTFDDKLAAEALHEVM